nr:Chain B, Rhomboid-related protein 4 [Homo sapiens]
SPEEMRRQRLHRFDS